MQHDYTELYDEEDIVEMLQDMDNAITECGLWDWLKNYEPEHGKGFMFSNHSNLERIQEKIKYGGHSGSSYGWTMRVMERVAKQGWDNFRQERLKVHKPQIKLIDPLKFAEALQNSIPDGKQQYEAMRKFSEGKISYAEMRGLCG